MYEFSGIEKELFSKINKIDKWSIVGAKALSYHGYHRYTGDTDILCHTSVAKDILKVFKQLGGSLVIMDDSHVIAEIDKESFDILITSAPEYANALIKTKDYYATSSGLLDMYLLSDKEQNQYDAVNLIKITNTEPSNLVLELEFERYKYFLEQAEKDIHSFKPRLLEDEFDLESLLLELDNFE